MDDNDDIPNESVNHLSEWLIRFESAKAIAPEVHDPLMQRDGGLIISRS